MMTMMMMMMMMTMMMMMMMTMMMMMMTMMTKMMMTTMTTMMIIVGHLLSPDQIPKVISQHFLEASDAREVQLRWPARRFCVDRCLGSLFLAARGDFFLTCGKDGEVNLIRTETCERVGTCRSCMYQPALPSSIVL